MLVLFWCRIKSLNAWTGWCCRRARGRYIVIEAPLSGMSMNPPLLRFGPAGSSLDLLIYLTAPLIGMLLAVEVYVRVHGAHRVLCAKLHHRNNTRCIFRCGYRA